MAEDKNKGSNSNGGKTNGNKGNGQSRNYSNIGESNAKQEQLRKAMEVTPKPKPKDGGGKK